MSQQVETSALDYLIAHDPAFQSRARLSSLYSDFSQTAATNPDGYQANVAAWIKGLARVARAGRLPGRQNSRDLLCLHAGDELAKALSSKEQGMPLALGSVIGEALENHELIPVPEFLSSPISIYHRTWIPSIGQVATWTLKKLGVIGGPYTEKMKVGDYVLKENLEAAAKSILDSRASATTPVSNLYTHTTFLNEYSHVFSPTSTLSATDLSILLKHLSRDHNILTYNATTIKFSSSSHTPPTPITPEDVSIANLAALITSITSQIPYLQSRVSALDARARTAVKTNSKSTALATLRSKKIADTALSNRLNTLAQLEDIQAKIDNAATNVEMYKMMAASADVLRSLNKQVGGVEGAERVADRLKEEMGTVEEISGVIAEVGSEGAVVDEAEVDEEFEALMRVEREKKEAAERVERERKELEEKVAREKQVAAEIQAQQKKMEDLEKWEAEKRQSERQAQQALPIRPLEADLQGQSREDDDSVADELEKSIDALSKMDLGEQQKLTQTQGQGEQAEQKAAPEREAILAS